MEPDDVGCSLDELGGQLLAGGVAVGEDERADCCRDQGLPLLLPVSDAVIAHQHDPAAAPHMREPCLIVGVRREDVVVCYDLEASIAKRGGNDLPTEAAVDEEGQAARGRTRDANCSAA